MAASVGAGADDAFVLVGFIPNQGEEGVQFQEEVEAIIGGGDTVVVDREVGNLDKRYVEVVNKENDKGEFALAGHTAKEVDTKTSIPDLVLKIHNILVSIREKHIAFVSDDQACDMDDITTIYRAFITNSFAQEKGSDLTNLADIVQSVANAFFAHRKEPCHKIHKQLALSMLDLSKDTVAVITGHDTRKKRAAAYGSLDKMKHIIEKFELRCGLESQLTEKEILETQLVMKQLETFQAPVKQKKGSKETKDPLQAELNKARSDIRGLKVRLSRIGTFDDLQAQANENIKTLRASLSQLHLQLSEHKEHQTYALAE